MRQYQFDLGKVTVYETDAEIEEIILKLMGGNTKGIDYPKLIQNGYDGIFVTENAAGMFHCYVDDETQDLNAWDCESICIFNPNVIMPVK